MALRRTLLLILALFMLGEAPALAQFGEGNSFGQPGGFGDFGGGDLLGGVADSAPPIELESFIVPGTNMKPALLVVRAKMARGWHVYSLTQKPGGPPKTQIAIEETDQFAFVKGEGFRAEEKPEIRIIQEAWPDLPIEEHFGQVTWVAPITLNMHVDPRTIQIKGELTKGQVCHDEEGCKPFEFVDTKFTAVLGDADQIAAFLPSEVEATGEFVDVASNVVIRGRIEPAVVAPGDTARLLLTVEPQPGWHVYERDDNASAKAYRPTLLPLVTASGLHALAPKADSQVISNGTGDDVVRYQDGVTTWTIEFPIPKDAEAGEHKIEGYLGYVVCAETQCLQPAGVQFRGTVQIGEQSTTDANPLAITASEYAEAQTALANSIPWSDPHASGQRIANTVDSINYAKLPLMIAFSLLGGLILNLMPCVLPVIGLKILSFAEQAGQDRAKVFTLNLAYSLGLLSVFLVLATLAVFLNLGWGEQFTSTWFNVAMCGLVFAMALSFLGVWEIPIPGFVGGETANKLEASEGPAGAFFKGILTTLLATPCSGPFLGPVFGFTLNQPAIVTYIIFGAIGLGMALPYLLIGVNPALVRFLPKPGAWMDTFKQVMGFVLLGTVVFLFSFMNKDYFVATFAMLVGIWLACWWIGRTPLTASAERRIAAWGGGALTAALIGFFAFTMLVPKETKIPWQPYSPAALAKAQAEGKTVMVDYTADWCLTCKTNLKFAINTDDVQAKVEQNDIVPLLADWSQPSDEIKTSLEKLESNSIPVLAIYPANRPGEVIVLRDLISQRQLLEALDKAGPSKSANPDEAAARTAMRPEQ